MLFCCVARLCQRIIVFWKKALVCDNRHLLQLIDQILVWFYLSIMSRLSTWVYMVLNSVCGNILLMLHMIVDKYFVARQFVHVCISACVFLCLMYGFYIYFYMLLLRNKWWWCWQGGHSSGKPGKVRELKSGQGNRKNQGKVRENELLQLFFCRDYCSDRNMQQWSLLLCISYTFLCKPILSHWSILHNVVVIDMSVYMSVVARNECICLYRYCWEGR